MDELAQARQDLHMLEKDIRLLVDCIRSCKSQRELERCLLAVEYRVGIRP